MANSTIKNVYTKSSTGQTLSYGLAYNVIKFGEVKFINISGTLSEEISSGVTLGTLSQQYRPILFNYSKNIIVNSVGSLAYLDIQTSGTIGLTPRNGNIPVRAIAISIAYI